MPEISEDGKTVTVKLKQGVTYSPPVSREVTSADVKYAIERAFTAAVANGYAGVYFGDLKGAPEPGDDYKEIKGIETPDDSTIVFNLTKGTGAALAGALAMPISVPVPKEYAQKYDKEVPSTYGEGHAVYTGPYMVESDAEGKATGYEPGRSIHIVRNPDYAAGRRLPARPTSTRSSSRPATTTAPWPRGASCPARAWPRATSSRRRASSSACSSPTRPSSPRSPAAAGA